MRKIKTSLAKKCFIFLVSSFFRIFLGKVKGIDNLPTSKGYIVAANHNSYIDHGIIWMTLVKHLGYTPNFLAKKELFDNPIKNAFHSWGGAIPIDRQAGGKKALTWAIKALKEGKIIVIYPEGTRSFNGKLQRAKTGVARLALAANVPVIPLGVMGTFEILPRWKRIPRLKKADLFIGKPLDLSKYQKTQDSPETLRKATTEIMEQIASLIKDTYPLENMNVNNAKETNTSEKNACPVHGLSKMIKGFQKTSLVDYPGKICATIFLGGCNMRCSYCYNKDLAVNHHTLSSFDENDILGFLAKRKNVLDAVCITGGEPTIHKKLPEYIKKIKGLGYAIKLDTNGTNPEMVEDLLKTKSIDYVAMDIKSSQEKYDHVTQTKVPLDKIKRTIQLLLSGKIPYEFRTTIIPGTTTEKDIKAMGEWIKGAKHLFLQQFKATKTMINPKIAKQRHQTETEIKHYKEILEKTIDHVEIRWA